MILQVKKISQIIVKKDMLILRFVDFQNSFRSIRFNLDSFNLQYIVKSLGRVLSE